VNKLICLLAIWVTLSWDLIPDAHYKVEAYTSLTPTWRQVSYGATTSVRLSLPEDMGLIKLRLVIIYKDGVKLIRRAIQIPEVDIAIEWKFNE